MRTILDQIIMYPQQPYYKAFTPHQPYQKAFILHKNWHSSLYKFFHQNSLIMSCCTFGRLEIRTLTLNRFKSQTNDTLELLGYNYSITPFLSPPLGFTPMGLNPNLRPLGLSTDPFSALKKIQKHCRCNFFFYEILVKFTGFLLQ